MMAELLVSGLTRAQILNECDPEGSLPLYLRHNDPMCSPLFSHNCSTKNVVLKITVPKCTGKRKRASQDSYLGIGPRFTPTEIDISVQNDLCSHSRIDGPKKLLRSLKDNADNYQVEAVAEVKRTHRFRGYDPKRMQSSKY
jgi:general transcription factor 3C polypeptide 5 (transcription factor C subunit 1)